MDDIFSTQDYKTLILEVFFVFVTPFPGLQDLVIVENYIDRQV